MCAIGRALMAKPKLMLLDEPSMGLAPLLVQEIFEIIVQLNEKENVAMLLAEQNASMALQYAKYGYIMENGRVVLDGDAETLSDNADVREFYLGLTEIGKKELPGCEALQAQKAVAGLNLVARVIGCPMPGWKPIQNAYGTYVYAPLLNWLTPWPQTRSKYSP